MLKAVLKNIVFVSGVNPLNNESNSTDIMTYNLLKGFKENGFVVKFIAISNANKNDLEDDFVPLVDELQIVKSKIIEKTNKYLKLFSILLSSFKVFYYKKISKTTEIGNNAIIISHSPSLESIYLSRELAKKKNVKRWIEYWSDPVTLSQISLTDYFSKYKNKRFIHKWIEKNMLKLSDSIVYGTRPLFNAQKTLFPQFKNKMSCIEPSFSAFARRDSKLDKKDNLHFIYAGNYYKNVRNIEPLFSFFERNQFLSLDVYGLGDCEPQSHNIKLHDRVSPEELEGIELSYQTTICLLNSKCIQIPGKVFYNLNAGQNILVIADGENVDETIDYLNTFQRFIIARNNVKDIGDKIKLIIESDNLLFSEKNIDNYSPKTISCKLSEM